MASRAKPALILFLFAGTALAATNLKQDGDLEAGRRAYEASDYGKAIESLQLAATKDPKNEEARIPE